jgi:hypothetical protein
MKCCLSSYVNGIRALSHRAKDAIEEITQCLFKAKEGSVKPPEIYLGANISKVLQLTDGREVWAEDIRHEFAPCCRAIA